MENKNIEKEPQIKVQEKKQNIFDSFQKPMPEPIPGIEKRSAIRK